VESLPFRINRVMMGRKKEVGPNQQDGLQVVLPYFSEKGVKKKKKNKLLFPPNLKDTTPDDG